MASPDVQDNDDEAVDLRVYLAVLGRRWKVVGAVIVLAVTASLLLSITQAKQYRATAELLIRTQSSESLISDRPTSRSDDARTLNNEVQLFESEPVERAVEAAYDGPLDPKDVRASIVSDTADVVRATLTSPEAEEGAKLLNLYVDTFITVRQRQHVDELLAVGAEIQAKIDDLTTRVNEVRAPIDDLERRVAASPDNAALKAQLDAQKQSLSSTLTPLESQRAFFQSQLEQLDLITEIAGAGGAQVVQGAKAEGAVSPNPLRDGMVALVLGAVLGVGLAFLIDTLDERVRTAGDLERVAGGVPTLALVPEMERPGATFVAVRDEAQGPAAEAFRGLRTALKFAAIDRPFRVVQVTSASAGEGKTTAVCNLAVAIAQGGDRVAIVCCDLRRPRIQERMQVPLEPGLTNVLLGEVELNGVVHRTEANVYVVPAGTPPPNPSELLSAERAAKVIQSLAQQVDIVLLDCPPVLPVTDSLVISRLADATVVVVDARTTERRAIRRTLQLLQQVGAPVVGLLLNAAPESGEYGYGYGYSGRYTTAQRGRTGPAPTVAPYR